MSSYKCPSCGGSSTNLVLKGWLVYGTVTVAHDPRSGNLMAVSPIVASTTVKPEVLFTDYQKRTEAKCPRCGQYSPLSKWEYVQVSVFDPSKQATRSVQNSLLGHSTIHYAEDEESLVTDLLQSLQEIHSVLNVRNTANVLREGQL